MCSIKGRASRYGTLVLIGAAALSRGLSAQSTIPTISIAWVTADANGDHQPDRAGSSVSVRGTLTTAPLPSGDTAYYAYVQDGTGGAQILIKGRPLARLRVGDVVRVTGVIGTTRSVAQIVAEQIELQQRNVWPHPRKVPIKDLISDRYLGQLVKASGELEVTRVRGSLRITLNDGIAKIQVRPHRNVEHIPGFSAQLVTGRRVEIVGLAAHRGDGASYEAGYRLEPREAADFRFLTPPNYYKLLTPLLFAGLVAALVWVRFRQRHAEAHAQQLAKLTEELQASEDAYRRSERRYRSLTENAEDGIAVIRRDGMIIFSTPAFDRLLSDAGTVTGVSLWRFVAAEDEGTLQRALSAVAVQEGASASVEFQCSGTMSKTRRLDTHLTNLAHEPSVGGIILNARDVTGKRAAEEALAASEERLRQAQRMEVVGRLAGGIAHDFNNLLTVIRGHAELLLGEVKQESWRANVDQIHVSADRAAAMTRQLLAFSRQQVLQPRTVRPGVIIREMQPMLTRLIGEHIELVAEIEDKLSHVRVDPAQLELAIMNLVINSRDAMPSGGRIVVGARSVPPEQSIVIWVEDNGCGMDADTLTQAFEPFFTTKGVGKGTGLGLPSVSGFVQQSGGKVNAQSGVGRGTRIELRLPIAEPETAKPGVKAIEASGGGETILVVEDEAPVRDLIRRFLERDGFSVILASSGCEALEFWRSSDRQIDLVLSDVVMPGTTGPQLAKEIQRTASHVPVLLMSGYTQDAIEEYAPAQGLLAIEKPFSRQELTGAIRSALNVPLRVAA